MLLERTNDFCTRHQEIGEEDPTGGSLKHARTEKKRDRKKGKSSPKGRRHCLSGLDSSRETPRRNRETGIQPEISKRAPNNVITALLVRSRLLREARGRPSQLRGGRIPKVKGKGGPGSRSCGERRK